MKAGLLHLESLPVPGIHHSCHAWCHFYFFCLGCFLTQNFLPYSANLPLEPSFGPSSYRMAFLTTHAMSQIAPYLGAIVNVVLFLYLNSTHMVPELLA